MTFLLLLGLFSPKASAYPDFISYGYNTCITCHFNAHGNGPLTDYGRALFSQEIAARNFWTPKSVDDEKVAENSGFIPGVQLPYWIRPGLKYRGLYVESNPGSSNKRTAWIRMQRDVNLVLSADEGYRTVLVMSYGLLHEPDTDYYNNGKKVDGVSREYYLRFFPFKKLLFSAGLMDIAYGLRTADHTSLARGALGLGQNDQVHGAMLEWFEDNWEASLHAFTGNLSREKNAQKQGVAIQFEYMLLENDKLGFSVMQANTETSKTGRFAIHNRLGLKNSPGTSLLAEVGLKQDQQTGQAKQEGAYGMLQSIINLRRGYNIITTIERAQVGLKSSATESSRWTLGFLLFPLQRTELRLTMVQTKAYSPTVASRESTALQGQIHVSF